MVNKTIETKFNEEENLGSFLNMEYTDFFRRVVGKSFLHRHCGKRMLKIQEIGTDKIHEDGTIRPYLNKRILYCKKCGANRDY